MRPEKLSDKYTRYKNKFNQTGIHPHPSELLAILLLQEKDKYKTKDINPNTFEFYLEHKESISEKIDQVIVDFAISKQEMIEIIEKNGITYSEELYEEHKIWFVFANGIRALQWGLINHPNWSEEELHNAFSAYWQPQINRPKGLRRTRKTKPTTINI